MPSHVSATRPIHLAAWRGGLASLRLLLLYFILCFVVYELVATWQTQRTSAQHLRQPTLATTNPAAQIPFLGINLDLLSQPPHEQAATLHRLREQGFGWARQRFDWAQLEPQPGQFAWADSDRLLAAIQQSGLIPVAVLDGSPAWARAERDRANPLAPADDPASFARFATAFADRYQAHVQFYQLWDEPNIAPHWGQRHIEPIDYAHLLKATSPAIRQADPDAVILLAALAPTADRGHTAIDEVYFLERLYAAGVADHFDAVAVQAFGFGYSPDFSAARVDLLNFQRVRLVRHAMIAARDGETPIWAVRFGWNRLPDTAWPTVSAADQRQFAVRGLQIGHTDWPWLAAMGWALDRPTTADDPQRGFALTPGLATAMAQAVATLEARPLFSLSKSPPWGWWAGIASLLLIGWRAWAAWRCIPWRTWADWYRRGPGWLHLGCWLLLGLGYYLSTWPPAIGLTWLGAALLVAVRPSHGVIGALFTLPFYFQHKELGIASLNLTWPPVQSFCLALLPTVLLRGWVWLSQTARPRLQALDWLALSWLLLNLISMINGWQWPAFGRGLVEGVLTPLILYAAIRQLAMDNETIARFSAVLALSVGLVAVIGLGHWLAGGGTVADGVRRLVGPYFSPNHAALYFVRTVPIVCAFWLAHSARRWFWGALALLLLVALFLTASRGAWLLGLPAASLFLGLVWLRTRQGGSFRPRLTPKWLMLLLIAIAAFGASLLLIWPRLTNSATLLNRFAIWQNTLHLWADFPWLGVGPGGFFWRYPAYVHPGDEFNLLHPHNLWLEIVATWGGLGLLWFLGLLVAASKVGQPTVWSTRRQRWLAAGLWAGLVAGLAHAQVDAFWALPDLAAWNWGALALLVAQVAHTPTEADTEKPRTNP